MCAIILGMIEGELIPTIGDTLTLQTRPSTPAVNIGETLRAYYDGRKEHDRECSWEYCYKYFHHDVVAIKAEPDHAALQLGFYLASWGMYRPSSFLFQHAYTVHLGVVDCLLDSKFSKLWSPEFGGSDKDDEELVRLILDAYEDIRKAYCPFGAATPTLVTKVLLGTICCFPALDDYFKTGFKEHFGFNVPETLDSVFIRGILDFCRDHLQEFQAEQEKYGVPLMKLVDAYFHRKGLESEAKKKENKQNQGATAGGKLSKLATQQSTASR
jgi:hypothetical protein